MSDDHSSREQHLDLTGNGFTDDMIGGLVSSFPGKLDTLDLRDNRIQKLPIEILHYFDSSSLVSLNLDRNRLADQGLQILSQNLCSIKSLSLRANDISYLGLLHLCRELRSNSTLQQLYLSQNDIRDSGAEELAKTLASNQSLKSLHISFNNIGLKGARALANALNASCRLETFAIMNNPIGIEGISTIYKAVSKTKLQSLIIGNTLPFNSITIIDRTLAEYDTFEKDSPESILSDFLKLNPPVNILVVFGLSSITSLVKALSCNSILTEITLVGLLDHTIYSEAHSIIEHAFVNRTVLKFEIDCDPKISYLRGWTHQNYKLKQVFDFQAQMAIWLARRLYLLEGIYPKEILLAILERILEQFSRNDQRVIISVLWNKSYLGRLEEQFPGKFTSNQLLKACYYLHSQ